MLVNTKQLEHFARIGSYFAQSAGPVFRLAVCKKLEDTVAIQQLDFIKLRNYVVDNMKSLMNAETWKEAVDTYPNLPTQEYLEQAVELVRREHPKKAKGKGKPTT